MSIHGETASTLFKVPDSRLRNPSVLAVLLLQVRNENG